MKLVLFKLFDTSVKTADRFEHLVMLRFELCHIGFALGDLLLEVCDGITQNAILLSFIVQMGFHVSSSSDCLLCKSLLSTKLVT